MSDLAHRIDALDFGTVFTVRDGEVIKLSNEYAPSVYHDPDSDVIIDGDGWSCFTGLTGQYSYHGAVMHPSEYIGDGIAELIAEHAEDDEDAMFAIVTVEDFDDEEPVGWAIAYKDRKDA